MDATWNVQTQTIEDNSISVVSIPSTDKRYYKDSENEEVSYLSDFGSLMERFRQLYSIEETYPLTTILFHFRFS